MTKIAYTISEAAEACGLGQRSLRYLIGLGKIGYTRVGRRVLIPRAELERLLKRAYQRPVAPLQPGESIRPTTCEPGAAGVEGQ